MERNPVYDTTMAQILKGGRHVVSDAMLDYFQAAYPDEMNSIATCMNAKQVGTLDKYVAWRGKENTPLDLVWRDKSDMMAYGSIA